MDVSVLEDLNGSMVVEAGDLEELAHALYRDLGLDPAEPAGPAAIARRWLGADAVVRAPATLPAPACTFFVGGQRKIAVKANIAPPYRKFWIGHELGHALLARHGLDDSELSANFLAAALMAPRAFVRGYGDDWKGLAADIGSTQTQGALRTAEVLQIPRAIMTPARVYVRSPSNFVWPLAKRKYDRLPGVRRTPIDDDPERYVLDWDDVG